MACDEEIVKLYKKGLSLKDVAKETKYKSPNTIKKILLKNNIKIRSRAGFKKLFFEDFFNNVDREDKAYFLGYMMADGNVYERKNSQPCIRMELNIKDIYILKKFEECLKLKNCVKFSRKNCCILKIHSKIMFDDLNKYGVIPNKTGKEVLPNLNKEMMNHFIRGFFDGDGWCTNTTSHYKNKGSRKSIGFVSNYNFLYQLREYLCKNIGIKKNKIVKRQGCYMLLWSSKKDTKSIYDFMYNNANIFLERKYKSCIYNYANTEVTGES